MPTSAEKDKDVAMGDADDIDMGDADDKNASDRGASSEVKAPPDADDFAPTPGMREIMVNFLVRMSFLTGESKDKQMLALHARSLSLLREALATWPSANIKFAFIEKLLASAAAAGGDATNTLRTGLAVFNVALDADAERFVSGNAPQLAQMLELCFNSRSKATHEALANALARAMYPPPPPGAAPGERGVPPPETKLLQHRLDELCAKHVAAAVAGAAGAAATPNAQTPDTSVACVLTCVSALAERNRRVVDRYLPHLVKLLSRLTHELNQASAAGAAPPPRAAARGAPPTLPAPEYGSAAHVMSSCVSLIASRVIPSGGEHKQLFLRMLLQLINDPNTHGAALMATLDAVKGWADDAVAGAAPGAVGDAAAIPAGVSLKREPADAKQAAGGADGDAMETDAKGEEAEKEEEEPSPPKTRGGKERPGPRGGKERPGAEAAREKAAAEKAARDKDEDDAEAKDGANDSEDGANDVQKEKDAEAKEAKDSKESKTASPFPEPNRPGSLSVKETVLFLSKLAHLTRLGREVTQTTEWEEKLLGTLHSLCAFEGHAEAHSTPDPSTPTLRQEVFQKVERNHLLGLRTRHPELRKKFFALYHGAVGQSLFHRLQFVLAGQEWDAMADTFWLKQGLDLILSTLAEDEKVTLAPNSARVPSLLPERGDDGGVDDAERRALLSDPKSGGPPPPRPPPRPTGRDAPKRPNEKTKAMLDRHAAFVHGVASLRVANLVGPLREVATRNAHVAYYLWVLVFPIVWATLRREEQMQLAKPMIALLSKEYHQRQAAVRPNVVQALLEGISLSQPQPKIPSELIKFLGKTYNAWHIAIALLENHVVRYPQEARCFDALAELYRLLGEQDVLVGLWRQRCNSEVTRVGLALTQHGHWQEAQDVFFRGMQRASAGQVTGVTKTELCLWETNWLESAKQLNQWELVSDFARSVDHTELQLHSSWRQNDWQGVKDLLPTSASTSEVEETPELYVIRVYTALNSGRVAEAEQCWKQAVKLLLDRWWRLPELGAAAHVPSLHSFQVLVELQESTRVLVELSNAQRPQHQNPGHCRTLIQDVMETWRLRTPNKWDPVPWWNEVLTWRGYMYNIIAGAGKSLTEIHPQLLHHGGHQLDQLGLRDRAWGINKLASAARRRGSGRNRRSRFSPSSKGTSRCRRRFRSCASRARLVWRWRARPSPGSTRWRPPAWTFSTRTTKPSCSGSRGSSRSAPATATARTPRTPPPCRCASSSPRRGSAGASFADARAAGARLWRRANAAPPPPLPPPPGPRRPRFPRRTRRARAGWSTRRRATCRASSTRRSGTRTSSSTFCTCWRFPSTPAPSVARSRSTWTPCSAGCGCLTSRSFCSRC
jgi:transformation/transcription domain-associated protein